MRFVMIFFRAVNQLKNKGKVFTCSKKTEGQVIVEYILLLVVSAAMALALIKLVSVNPDDNSIFYRYWYRLIKTVGEDIST